MDEERLVKDLGDKDYPCSAITAGMRFLDSTAFKNVCDGKIMQNTASNYGFWR